MTAPTREALDAWGTDPFWQWMGLRIDSIGDNRAVVSLDVQPHHRGGGGTAAVNGGVIAYLCDAALGAVVAGLRWPPQMVTVSLHVSYLAPTVGERISAEGVITSAGRSLVFADITIRSEDGGTSAQGRATARLFTKQLVDPNVQARENRNTP